MKLSMLVTFFLFFAFNLQADLERTPTAAPVVKEHTFPVVDVTEMRLANGMTVLLKQTDFENNEIFIKLEALGGYTSLPPADRFSGEIASQITWESGMGGKSAEQISVWLYEHSLELEPKIQGFSRTIEGSSGRNGLGAFLQVVQMLFMQKQFTQEGWKAAYSNGKDSLEMLEWDYISAYEAALQRVNTQGLPMLQPMGAEDLKKVDFDVAKEVFQRAFSDPSEFVCVIVGAFDMSQAKALISQYLGAITKTSDKPFPTNYKPSSVFPAGITLNEIQLEATPEEALTRLTFPVQISLDKKTMLQVAFLCQVIEARLRYAISQKLKLSYGIDASYEFPFYPLLDSPWISIRYRCDARLVDTIKQIILAELRELQESGVTAEEVQEIKQLEAGSDAFWLRDNFYWMSLLANYYLWHWELQWIYEGPAMVQQLSVEAVNHLLKTSFSLKNYSIVTAKP